MIKINAVGSAYDVYKPTKISKPESTAKTAGSKDTFVLSSVAKDYQTAMKAVTKSPDIRIDLVNEFRAKINSNNYNVDSADIANKILAYN